MSNVLGEAKKQQVIALGRLGWPLRRIEQETGVRRETAGAYLKAAWPRCGSDARSTACDCAPAITDAPRIKNILKNLATIDLKIITFCSLELWFSARHLLGNTGRLYQRPSP